MHRLVDDYDAVLFDLDGVIYIGEAAVPGAAETIRTLRSDGIGTAYLTNNASRPPRAVAQHLRDLGIDAADEDVVTSAQAAARLLVELVPAGGPVLTIGGEGLAVALTEAGLRPVFSADDAPLAIVSGFGHDVGWKLLAEGVFAVRRGLPWVASNLDLTIPTPRGIAPGNGLLVEVIKRVTGVEPQVAGKPARALVDEAVRRTGATRPLIVGDRLDTDIAAASAYGCDSLLVLSGVTTPAEFVRAPAGQRATHVGADVTALLSAGSDDPAMTGLLDLARRGWDEVDAGRTLDLAAELADLGLPST